VPTILVEAIAGIARHLEVIYHDHELAPMSADDSEFVQERQVFIPVRV
jgi:hypothetical protein